jgi:hypothetical protein
MLPQLSRFLQQPLHFWSAIVAAASLFVLIVVKGFPVVKEWVSFKKEILETEKVRIELAALKEKGSKSVELATQEEIETFDPKTRLVIQRARVKDAAYHRVEEHLPSAMPLWVGWVLWVGLLILGLTGLLILTALFHK